ncbi:MAG TPA: hypothetical protein VD994_02545 [Prosthecobacter sp.]|nr:hypothetical protein [Prosthecobacter sp.]
MPPPPLKPRSPALVCILDCVQGTRIAANKLPFIIGAGAAADFRLTGSGCPDVACALHHQGDHVAGYLAQAEGLVTTVDSERASSFTLRPGEEHTVVVGDQILAFKYHKKPSSWEEPASPLRWHLYDKQAHAWSGPFEREDVATRLAGQSAEAAASTVAIPEGMEQMGFFVRELSSLFPLTRPSPKPLLNGSAAHAAPPPQEEKINSEYGQFTCPICWFKFDRGDAMNIAVHASLRGDAHLGEDQMQRFHATRFNDRGQALDAMGIPAPDLACPHCRRKLPPGFMDTPHHIFSIVGAPSSGKSYYLSVLVKMLQSSLFQHFSVTFRDADPSENVILTQMKTQLFSAGTPEEAFLAKTELEGALYESLPRLGRKVRLPKPFVFKVSQAAKADSGFSVVFYDNAGEHFEPRSNSADSPGAQHIAVASGIFFLFDPLHNTEFRNRLQGVSDPQMAGHRLDQQDVILAETEVRIKSILGLDSRQRVDTPLAVMLGKCDTWLHLLGSEPLLPPVQNGALSLESIRKNSARIRALLLEICPAIVANAEAISANVAYFAISPLGCSPVEFTDREGHRRIGPDPKNLRPQHVEAPTLWVLSQIAPDIIPAS